MRGISSMSAAGGAGTPLAAGLGVVTRSSFMTGVVENSASLSLLFEIDFDNDDV